MVIVSSPSTAPQAGPSSRRIDYTHAYHRIRTASRTAASSSASSVLLLVAPDVDALCAARILTSLLNEDDIPHRIVPVNGFTELINVIAQDVRGNDDIRSIVMVNLGSALELPSLVPLPPACTLHVIDSHRPWNIESLFATTEINQRIWIWDDGEIDEKLSRPGGERDAFEKLEFDVDDADSDSDHSSRSGSASDGDDDDDKGSQDDDDSDDNGRDGGSASRQRQGRKRRRRASPSSSRASSDDSDNGDDDQDDNDASNARSHGKTQRIEKRLKDRHRRQSRPDRPVQLGEVDRRRLRNVLLRYYDRGTSVGMSVAGMMYLLADKLGRGGRDGLWLAILGLTFQYLSSSISSDTYDAFAAAYASEVHAIEPSSTTGGIAGGTDPWSAESAVTAAGNGARTNPAAAALLHGKPSGDPDPDDAAIRVQPSELRFILYRHWSLETAMKHTAYVASKIGTWGKNGDSKLRSLMAKMGFSLSECRQHFPHMSLDLRRTLVRKMEQMAPEYGLTDLTYRGFSRGFGFRSSPLSAADVVEGLSALLVAAHGTKIEVKVPGMGFVGEAGPLGNSSVGNGVGGESGAGGSELFNAKRLWSLSTPSASSSSSINAAGDVSLPSDTQPDPSTLARSTIWRKNFYEAFRALDRGATSIALLRSSLLLSQSLHRAIVQRGTALIRGNAISTLSNVRYAILKEGSDLELFAHVDVLVKLARWLVDALRDVVGEVERKRIIAKKRRRFGNAAAFDEREVEVEARPFPLILAALDAPRRKFVVVGEVGASAFGETESNTFGHAFGKAAEGKEAEITYDRLETKAIELGPAQLTTFFEDVNRQTMLRKG